MNFQKYFKIFSTILGTTLFHPQFFSKFFLNRQVKKKAFRLEGLTVDLGCGNGPYKKYFAHTNYFGLDYPGTVADDVTRNKSVAIYGDLMSIPFKDASIDSVICTQVLEHIPEPWTTISEIGRVMKPGGRLLLSVPFFYPLHDEPFDFFRFSPHGLKSILVKANFKVLEVIPQGGFVTMACEFFNLFCLHGVQKLLFRKGIFTILGICLVPMVLSLSILANFIALFLSFFDKDRRFVMNYFIFAERIINEP